MGFEAGQHEALTSEDHHEAVIWSATQLQELSLRGSARTQGSVDPYLRRAKRWFESRWKYRYRHSNWGVRRNQLQDGSWLQNFQPVRRGSFGKRSGRRD
jgi:hypothetical protein